MSNSHAQQVLCLVTSTSYYLRGMLSSVIASEIFSLKAYDFHLFTFTLFVFFFSSDLSSKPLLHGTIFSSSLFLFFLTHSLTHSLVCGHTSLSHFFSLFLSSSLPTSIIQSSLLYMLTFLLCVYFNQTRSMILYY